MYYVKLTVEGTRKCQFLHWDLELEDLLFSDYLELFQNNFTDIY